MAHLSKKKFLLKCISFGWLSTAEAGSLLLFSSSHLQICSGTDWKSSCQSECILWLWLQLVEEAPVPETAWADSPRSPWHWRSLLELASFGASLPKVSDRVWVPFLQQCFLQKYPWCWNMLPSCRARCPPEGVWVFVCPCRWLTGLNCHPALGLLKWVRHGRPCIQHRNYLFLFSKQRCPNHSKFKGCWYSQGHNTLKLH